MKYQEYKYRKENYKLFLCFFEGDKIDFMVCIMYYDMLDKKKL